MTAAKRVRAKQAGKGAHHVHTWLLIGESMGGAEYEQECFKTIVRVDRALVPVPDLTCPRCVEEDRRRRQEPTTVPTTYEPEPPAAVHEPPEWTGRPPPEPEPVEPPSPPEQAPEPVPGSLPRPTIPPRPPAARAQARSRPEAVMEVGVPVWDVRWRRRGGSASRAAFLCAVEARTEREAREAVSGLSDEVEVLSARLRLGR